MRLKDLTREKDPLYDLFTLMGEDEEKRKKKKKKKKKDKQKKEARSRFVASVTASARPTMEELRAMGKKELRDYIVEKNIPAGAMDLVDKKSMRKAILAYYAGGMNAGVVNPDAPTVALQQTAQVPASRQNRPPYYYDEDTGEFVIPGARDTSAMNCYDAMSALGEVRRRRDPADDFTHLMDTLTKRIIEEAKRPQLPTADVVEAEFEVLEDKPAE